MTMLFDPGKVLVAISFFGAIALSIRAIAAAVVRVAEIRAGEGRKDVPSETSARLERIEQGLDAIAIEVERISEAQRFTTKLLAERVSEPERIER